MAQLAHELQNIDPEKGLEYATQGLLLAEKLKFEKGKADCLSEKGEILIDISSNKESAELLLQALSIYENLADQYHQAKALRSVGRTYADIELKSQKTKTNATLIGGFLLLLTAIISIFAYRQKRKDNKLITIEKQRSEELLLNNLPEEIAEELKNKGSADAKHFDEVTVLFTDFVNFTRHSERLSPTELVASLNDCFTAFDAIIERNGLEKIKTIGDAYMAVCGLPNPDPQHALKTVKASLEFRDYIAKRNQKYGKEGFEIRIGLHSGSVVAGIIGVKKFSYDTTTSGVIPSISQLVWKAVAYPEK